MSRPDGRIPVLLMVRELTLGGSERQLAEMARALDPARFVVHVGCFKPGGIRASELEQAGVPILPIAFTSFLSPAGLLKAIRSLRTYVRQHSIQIVHGFDPPSCLLLGIAARWLRPARVLTSQRNHQHVRKPLMRAGMRIAHRMADGIVVNCEAMREHLVHDEHLRRDRIHLCYNGLDIRRFRRLSGPPRDAVPQGALVVGTLCALRPEKNLPLLLEAFGACRQSAPHLFLLIVGSGPEKPKLEARAAELGISSSCRFEPTAADVVPWLSLMDVFVLSSRFEALPNALMEAMACGCAPIASRVGGTPELIVPGESGLLFESDNVSELTGHLRRLIAEPALRQRLATNAAERMVGFSLEASAGRLGSIYDDRLRHAASASGPATGSQP